MAWTIRLRRGRPRAVGADVDSGEAVSDAQLAATCLACTAVDGTIQLSFADGQSVVVPDAFVARSRVLQELAEASLECSTGGLVPARSAISCWYRYMERLGGHGQAWSSVVLLRYLQASDFLADSETVQELCEQLGARLFAVPEQLTSVLKTKTSAGSCTRVLDELPEHLAETVIQASSATLHACLASLPPRHHSVALLAHCPQITSSHTLHLTGQESAKVPVAPSATTLQSLPSQSTAPVDTIVVALKAAALHFSDLRCVHLHSMHVHHARGSAITHLVTAVPELEALKITECDVSTQALDSVACSQAVAAATRLTSLELAECIVTPPMEAAGAVGRLIEALPNVQHLVVADVSVCRKKHAHKVLHALRSKAMLKTLRLERIGMTSVDVQPLAEALRQMPGLESLALLGHRVHGADVDVLAAALRRLTALERLDVELGSVLVGSPRSGTSRCSIALSSALGSLPRLKHVYLRGYLGKEGLDMLSRALPALPSLQHLEISESRYCFTYPEGAALFGHLPRVSELSSLTLTNVDLHAEGCHALAASLQSLPSLKKLFLGFSEFMETDVWVPVVMPAVRELTKLEHLGLSCFVDALDNAHHLAFALSSLTSLQRLLLHAVFARDSFGRVVLGALSPLTKLTDLRLCAKGIDGDITSHMCSVVGGLTQLQRLLLWRKSLGSACVESIAGALSKLTQLHHLDIAFANPFRDREYLFAEALAQLTQLKYLAACGLQLQCGSHHMLTPAMTKLRNLEHLALKSVAGLGGRRGGMHGVAGFIRNLPRLRTLQLSNSALGDSGAAVLAPALGELHRLREVDLSKTGITDEGAAQVVDAVSGLYMRKLCLYGNRGIVNKQAGVFRRPGVLIEES